MQYVLPMHDTCNHSYVVVVVLDAFDLACYPAVSHKHLAIKGRGAFSRGRHKVLGRHNATDLIVLGVLDT